jgi:hypothetical protein
MSNQEQETTEPELTLEQQKTLELNTIESLITAGTDHIIPIIVSYMGKQFSVNVRPLNAVEYNTIQNNYIKNKTSPDLSICLKGMLKSDETNFTREELLKLPGGIISRIAQEINAISGQVASNDVDQNEIIKDIMGF